MTLKYDETIDKLYHKKLKDFYNRKSVIIPKLNLKIEELERKKTEENTAATDQQIKILSRKKDLVLEEIDRYFLENAKSLFEYFETKQDIDKNMNQKKKINTFFNVKDNRDAPIEAMTDCVNTYMEKNCFESINLTCYAYNKTVCTHCNVGELIKVNHEGIITVLQIINSSWTTTSLLTRSLRKKCLFTRISASIISRRFCLSFRQKNPPIFLQKSYSRS